MNIQNSSNYKSSRFNVSERQENGTFLMVNTMTGAILNIKESQPTTIHKALLRPEAPFDFPINEETHNLLLDNGFIVFKNYNELEVLKERLRRSRRGIRALGLAIIPTLSCNFRCTYCYQNHRVVDMPQQIQNDILKYVAKNIEDRELLMVTWFGGEPLLRMRIIQHMTKQLLTICQQSKVSYEAGIVTNGFLLSPHTTNILLDMGVRKIQVTLDGPAELHDQRRFLLNGQPTFHRIIQNLTRVSELFDEVIIRVNIDDRNSDTIPELLESLHPIRKHVLIAFRATTSPESPDQDEQWCLPPRDFWPLDRQLNKLALDSGFDIAKGYVLPGTSFCSAYQKNSITIDPYGDLHRCPVCIGRRNLRYGVLLSNGEIVVREGVQSSWDTWDPFQDKDCSECKALPICMGGCLWYSGDKDSSFRCFAKQNIIQGILGDITFTN